MDFFPARDQEVTNKSPPTAAPPLPAMVPGGRGSERRLRVAVIGAGAAGLASAKHALASPDRFLVTVYERGTSVGGTWLYSDEATDRNNVAVHSAMYKSLRTNLPKQTMAFLDFPFPLASPSFLQRKDVLSYLESYAKAFNVIDSIQFKSRVMSVSPSMDDDDPCWRIQVDRTDTGDRLETLHDAVMVCNGHFFEPRIPTIPGLESFSGHVIHSHSYRTPEPFRGLKVVCLGAGSSGVDISAEIASVAEKVYFSHKHNSPVIPHGSPSNMVEVVRIVEARSDAFRTSDGQWLEAHVLVFCTGYLYAFPFLSPECHVRVHENRVTPLYKHLINTGHPTMAFVGLPFRVCPFPTFDLQAQYFLATLTGQVTLPSRELMMEETERELQTLEANGVPQRFTHQLDDKQWLYFAELAAAVGTSPPKSVVENLYRHVSAQRRLHPYSYRQKNFEVVDDEKFVEIGDPTGRN